MQKSTVKISEKERIKLAMNGEKKKFPLSCILISTQQTFLLFSTGSGKSLMHLEDVQFRNSMIKRYLIWDVEAAEN